MRRQLLEIRGDVPKDWSRAEKAKHASGTERIADSLVDSVAAGNLDVEPVRLQPTNLECHDDVISTIESLPRDNSHPLQVAWIKHDVPQCGYCQSGQLMSAAALLASNKNPSDADIDQAMRGNVCRCGTYPRVRAAIKDAAATMRKA